MNPEIPQLHQETPADISESLLEEVLAARVNIEKVHDPQLRERLERAQLAMEDVAIPLSELHKMPHDEQLEVLDQIVDNVFDADEEAQATIEQIKLARERGNEDAIKRLTTEQKNRYNIMRRDVASAIGVEIEDTEKENDEYRYTLLARVADMGDQPEEDIMRDLGFLKKDSDGQDQFNFPEDLFPPHIVEKWRSYEGTIKSHVAASNRFNRAIDDNSDEIIELDALRRYSHNNLAKSVQEFLKLEDWDFERVRKFITKLVEHRFPAIETSERKVTSKDVITRLRTIQALGSVVADHNNHK